MSCLVLFCYTFAIAEQQGSADTLVLSALSDDHRILINDRLFIMQSGDEVSSAQQALTAFKQGRFTKNTSQKVSFGFTNQALWAVLPVWVNFSKPVPLENATDIGTSHSGLTKVIEIDNAWLDKIDLFFIENADVVRRESIGDTEFISQRTYNARMPTLSHEFPAGETLILFRFMSQDPMTIPVYLNSENKTKNVMLENAYFYGFLYGALFMLLVYNLVLYLYLGERSYLFYSCYLLAFILFNFTYTGHGYWWFWGDFPSIQQWLMPTLMFCYITAGVTFTIEFLNIKKYLPALYVKRSYIYLGLFLLASVMLIYGSQLFAILVQLIILTTMSVWMLIIGLLCYKNGNVCAKFFVPAIVLGTGGATVSSMATWGVIPYSQWAFRGIEIGMFLEMSLLSTSLGFNVKEVYKARVSAEITSRVDPLTSLYNRRAFTQLVHPIWEMGVRKKQNMAIVLIDLDWFKRINDQFGHGVGDNVLELVAKTIKGRVRNSDLVFRWGGEEFLLFLPDTNLNEAELLAETLRYSVEKETSEHLKRATISVGIAVFNEGNASQINIDKMIKRADKALYLAKHKGRNCVVST